MIFDVLNQLNWVDILIISLLARIIYISAKNGIFIESFKLIGIIFAIYLTFHYYIVFPVFITKQLPSVPFAMDFLTLLVVGFLIFIGYFTFVLLRNLFSYFAKMQQEAPLVSRCAGVILGSWRGLFSGCLVIFIMSMPIVPYFNASAKNSYSGRRLLNLGVNTYSGLWNSFMSKFVNNEKFNTVILDLQKDFNGRK